MDKIKKLAKKIINAGLLPTSEKINKGILDSDLLFKEKLEEYLEHVEEFRELYESVAQVEALSDQLTQKQVQLLRKLADRKIDLLEAVDAFNDLIPALKEIKKDKTRF